MNSLEQDYKKILNRFELIFGVKIDNNIATNVLDSMNISIIYDKKKKLYELFVEGLLFFETKDDAVHYYTNLVKKLKDFILLNYPSFTISQNKNTNIDKMDKKEYIDFVSEYLSSKDLFLLFNIFLNKF